MIREGSLEEVCALIQKNLENLTNDRLKDAVEKVCLNQVATRAFYQTAVNCGAAFRLFCCRGKVWAGAELANAWIPHIVARHDPKANLLAILEDSDNVHLNRKGIKASAKFLLLKQLCDGQLRIFPYTKHLNPQLDNLYVRNDFGGRVVERMVKYLQPFKPTLNDLMNEVIADIDELSRRQPNY